MVTITVKITIVLLRTKTVLTHQLPITRTTTDRPTPTTKEKLIIVPTKDYVTPTYNHRTTPKDEFTITTSDLVKIQINGSITLSINIHTITPNIIERIIVFAALTNILK